jgi:hypothetical protein
MSAQKKRMPGAATIAGAPPRVKKSLSGVLGNSVDSVFNTAQNLNKQAGTFDRDTSNIVKSLLPYKEKIDTFFSEGDTNIDNSSTWVQNNIYSPFLKTIREQTNGFSEHVGAMLAGLDGVVQKPLDPYNLSNMATAIMERVSKGSSTQLNNSIQNLQLDKLAKAPALLFSGIQRLARGIDNLLSIPLSFINSIYKGLINLVKRIGKEINELIQGFQTFLFDFLDTIIPIKQVMSLLQNIGQLAGQIQGIASIFGGVNTVTQFSMQLNLFTTQVNGALSTPLETVGTLLPPDIFNGYSQIMYNLQNPENVINQLLPLQLSEMFDKVSLMTGYGFNGNMGYGLGSMLEGLQGGVISGILEKFAAQYNILGPLLGKGAQVQPTGADLSTDNGYTQGNRYDFEPNPNPYNNE